MRSKNLRHVRAPPLCHLDVVPFGYKHQPLCPSGTGWFSFVARSPVKYDKPHLTLTQQVEKLVNRGLAIPDQERTARFLETIGYYRVSAYAYPFRELLDDEAPRGSSVQFRSNSFIPGAQFTWVEDMWRFDRDLRLLVMDAIEIVEIALRSKVGYHLGLRHTLGHLDAVNLDSTRANQPDNEEPGRSMFDVWLERYLGHQDRAAESEDFIKHYVEKYEGNLPVWVATETMELGPLVRLYGFMTDSDRSQVAGELGQISGAVFVRWMKVANYLRNASAHHARLWNPEPHLQDRANPRQCALSATSQRSRQSQDRVYGICATLAHLTSVIRPDDRWRARFVELMDSFPTGPPVAPETHMGFPARWRELDVWNR